MLSVVGRESMVKYINAGTTAEEAETTMFDRLKEMNSEEIVEQSNLVGRIFIVKRVSKYGKTMQYWVQVLEHMDLAQVWHGYQRFMNNMVYQLDVIQITNI